MKHVFNVTKTKRIAKFDDLKSLRLRRYGGNCGTWKRPEKFRDV